MAAASAAAATRGGAEGGQGGSDRPTEMTQQGVEVSSHMTNVLDVAGTRMLHATNNATLNL